jgi:hypothetical protein
MKGKALDELYILPAGDQSSKSGGIALQTITWTEDFSSPLLADVLHILYLTSKTLTDRYTATE